MDTIVETRAKPGKYLTFALGPEEFGLEILKVREIIGYMDITAVPQTPEHVRGVINLRGQVIPVVDLRTKFAMRTEEITSQTCIIVVETHQGDQKFNTIACETCWTLLPARLRMRQVSAPVWRQTSS
jgi:purine-binding chemotaxis protein CheW